MNKTLERIRMDYNLRRGGYRKDEDKPDSWITVEGNHIPLDENGNPMGGQLKALGGSIDKEKEINDKLMDLCRSKESAKIKKRTINKIFDDLPVGSKVVFGEGREWGTTYTKKGKNKYQYEDDENFFEYRDELLAYVDGSDIKELPTIHLPDKNDKKKATTNGIKLYKKFTEADYDKIHKLLGYDVYTGKYDPGSVDQQAAKDIDSVFSPAKNTMELYRGMPMPEDEAMKILKKGKKYLNHTLSSTSKVRAVSAGYAENAYESEGLVPVLFYIKAMPGTPIADAVDLLGSENGKGFQREITIGRNTEWIYDNVEVVDDDGLPYYHVDVTVRPKK